MTDMNERRALREGAVFSDGDSHDILRATGNDRASFLHRITSGKLAGVEVGQGGRTLLLDVRGHVLASLLAFVREADVRLVVPGGQGAAVATILAKYAIMDDFQIAPEADLVSLAVLGPQAAAALGAAGVELPSALREAPRFAHLDVVSHRFGSLWLARGHRCGVDGFCVVSGRAGRDALVQALLATSTMRLLPDVAEAARIAALEPAPGKEITPDRFPVEVGLGAAIDHGKGCYVGQETIVRMRDRGAIRKRLVLLRFASDELPGAGDAIAADGQPVAGQVTSAGRLSGESPIALAILASAVPVGAKVHVNHAGATLPAEVAGESPPWG